MRKLIYSMMVSLDGFIDGPNHDIGWSAPDEELHTFANDEARGLGAFLYGRRLYQNMVAFWPTVEPNPSTPAYVVDFARVWTDQEKVVFSTTLDHVEGNARLVRGDVGEEIIRMKAEPGADLGIGGATLAATAVRLGLVDEYRLLVHPVVIGGGTRFFPPLEAQSRLTLVETHTFGSGVVYLRYQRADGGS